MNLLADENIDRLIVERLRSDGHEVVYIQELAPGISDDQVLREANSRSALLLTADRDFGDMVYRQRLVHSGVIFIRLSGLSNESKADMVSFSIEAHAEQLVEAFSVISPGQVRIRRQR